MAAAGRSMKVCLVVATSGRTGVESVVLSLARGLLKAGAEVSVAMLSHGPLQELLGSCSVDSRVIPVKHKFDLLKISELREYFRAGRFDIVHAHGARAAFFTSLASTRLKSASLIVSIHELSDGTFRRSSVKRLENAVYKLSYKACIAVSKAVADDAVKGRGLSAARIFVIPNCLPDAFSERAADFSKAHPISGEESHQHGLVVGVAGRLDAVKGHKNLIQAWPKVLDAVPSARLDIAGAGPLEKDLVDLSAQLGIRQAVNFLGSVEDMVEFYRSINMLVVPSLSESFGITILEAMSCGIPVIASDVGGIREIVRNEWNGLLVPRESHVAISDAILRLWSDDSLRSKIISNGFKSIEPYKQEAFILSHMEAYKSINPSTR